MDEKKLRVYTTAVSIAGLSVFSLSLWEVYPYYLPGSSRGDIWSYSLMMVLLMVVCRMLPIYFAEDKTLEISFVPVLACAITGGAPLAVGSVRGIDAFHRDAKPRHQALLLAIGP